MSSISNVSSVSPPPPPPPPPSTGHTEQGEVVLPPHNEQGEPTIGSPTPAPPSPPPPPPDSVNISSVSAALNAPSGISDAAHAIQVAEHARVAALTNAPQAAAALSAGAPRVP